MTVATLQSHYAAVRARLRNPSNPGRDTEIDLGRQSAAARSALAFLKEKDLADFEQLQYPKPPRPPKNKKKECYIEPPLEFDMQRIFNGRSIILPQGFCKARRIQAIVAMAYGINRSQLVSHRRFHRLVVPRQIAIYLCMMFTDRSTTYLAHIFGSRDHTTIIHANRKIDRLRLSNSTLNGRLEALSSVIRMELGQ